MATSPIHAIGNRSHDQVQVDAKPRDFSPSPPLVIGVTIVVAALRAAIRAGCNQAAAIRPIDLPIPSVRPSAQWRAMVTSLDAAAAAIDLPLSSRSLLPCQTSLTLRDWTENQWTVRRTTGSGRADAGGDPKNDLDVLRGSGRGRPDYGCVTCAVLPSEF